MKLISILTFVFSLQMATAFSSIGSILQNPDKLDAVSKSAFTSVDTDKSGYLDKAELGKVMQSVAKDLGIDGPTAGEVGSVFSELDTNKDGKLSLSEFKVLITQVLIMMRGPSEQIQEGAGCWDVSTIAGDGTYAYQDGPAAKSRFFCPSGVLVDDYGKIFVADSSDNRIRVIDQATSIVSTLAGSGTNGNTDAKQTSAQFNNPFGMAFAGNGDLLVTDASNNSIRRVTVDGTVSTFIAELNNPHGIVSDGLGICFYVVNAGDGKISQITMAADDAVSMSEIVLTAAVPALNSPFAITSDASGNLYIADTCNHMIRKIALAASGATISTVAGTGTAGNGDDQFNYPRGITYDRISNSLYVADSANNRIRRIKLDGASAISTIAGTGAAGYVDGTGLSATFNNPYSIACDGSGNLYVGDADNHMIRKLIFKASSGGEDKKISQTVAGLVDQLLSDTQKQHVIHVESTDAASTLPSDISGKGGLTKAGPGNLVLTGTNTYTGMTVIEQGTLTVTALKNLGTNPAVEFSGTGTFSTSGPASLTLDSVRLDSGEITAILAPASKTVLMSRLFAANDTTGMLQISCAGGAVFIAGALPAGALNYDVTSGSTLQLESAVSTGATGGITVQNGGILDLYTESATDKVMPSGLTAASKAPIALKDGAMIKLPVGTFASNIVFE
jgi:autotransporter-associated beta strand protein